MLVSSLFSSYIFQHFFFFSFRQGLRKPKKRSQEGWTFLTRRKRCRRDGRSYYIRLVCGSVARCVARCVVYVIIVVIVSIVIVIVIIVIIIIIIII